MKTLVGHAYECGMARDKLVVGNYGLHENCCHRIHLMRQQVQIGAQKPQLFLLELRVPHLTARLSNAPPTLEFYECVLCFAVTNQTCVG